MSNVDNLSKKVDNNKWQILTTMQTNSLSDVSAVFHIYQPISQI
jgi:hypothetical protein